MTFFDLFQSHPVPMWMYDQSDLTFVEVNVAALDQYGYSREELVGSSILLIRPATEFERLKSYLETVRPPKRKSGLWKHQRKDGSV
ncbi:MAG: PAS domain S-box protein, partial [Nitrospirae bacterium]|nr:PAS domain S-box protein [Fimbriimonadaceae bacterium]